MHRHSRPGFTIVEALVAGMVLALSALAIGGAISQSLQAAQLSRDFQLAAELAQQIMTRVDIIGPDRLLLEGPLEGEFPPPLNRFTWELDIDEQFVGSLYEVNLTLRWATGQRHRAVEVATLLTDPPGARSNLLRWEDLP